MRYVATVSLHVVDDNGEGVNVDPEDMLDHIEFTLNGSRVDGYEVVECEAEVRADGE